MLNIFSGDTFTNPAGSSSVIVNDRIDINIIYASVFDQVRRRARASLSSTGRKRRMTGCYVADDDAGSNVYAYMLL